MDDKLLGLFHADAAEAISRRRDDTQLAIARQRDGAAHDMRLLGYIGTSELLVSNDTSEISRLNAAVRSPTTLSHPNVVHPGAGGA